MKDREFSAAGPEFDASGREVSPPPREWNVPAELDRSGQEYRQRSKAPAVGRHRRRIRPLMALTAAAVTAVVAVSPLRLGGRSYPTRVPGAEAKAYLDYVMETVKYGELDDILTAAADPRLDQVIREEFAPYAMELSQRYGVEHTACGNDGESGDWTELEEFIRAEVFHVCYDGTVMALEGERQGEQLLVERRGTEPTDGAQTLENSFGIIRYKDDLPEYEIWTSVYARTDLEGTRSVRIEWSSDEIELLKSGFGRYQVVTSAGTRRMVWYTDRGEGTEQTGWHEEVMDGSYTYVWEADPLEEEGGYYTDYLENGTVLFRCREENGYEYDVTLSVVDGMVRLTERESYEISDRTDGVRLVTLYHHFTNTQTGETERAELYTAQVRSEEHVLYRLFTR